MQLQHRAVDLTTPTLLPWLILTHLERRPMIKPVIAASMAILLSGWEYSRPSRQEPLNRVMGAWRVVEFSRDSSGTRISREAQPGLYLFTHRHYSFTRVEGSTPRRDFPDELRRTSDTYLEIWGPFVAQAGTYEVQGDRLTTRPAVSKNPSGMVPNNFAAHTWRIAGDTLWLQQIANETGRVTDGPMFKLVRAERP
jgi:hypothetical protein